MVDAGMREFQHVDPARRILYGRGMLDRVAEALEQLGRRRALVLAGANMARSPLLQQLLNALDGRAAAVLSGISEHSGPDWVRRGVEMADTSAADVIISLGGGSTIDTGKCIALVALLGGDIADHRVTAPAAPQHAASLNAQPLLPPALPHICIPTTGSGSEVTPGAGLRAANGQKWIFWHASLPPQVILLDPQAAATTPLPVAASSSMNAMAHAVEAFYAVNAQPLTDACAAAALQRFGQIMPRLTQAPTDVAMRGELQQAWLLAGLSIANARVALHHALCHCLGARGGVPHGLANAVMLPHVMAFNAVAAQSALERAALALGAAGTAEAAVARVRELQAMLGLPSRLRDVGVPYDSLSALAEDAMHERATHFNPVTVTREDVLRLFQGAW